MGHMLVEYLMEGPKHSESACHTSLASAAQHPNWQWGIPTPSALVSDAWRRIFVYSGKGHGPLRRQVARSSRVDIREAVRKLWHFRKHTLELNEL